MPRARVRPTVRPYPASSVPMKPDLPKTSRVVCEVSPAACEGSQPAVRPKGLHMACSDRGRGRQSMPEKIFNSRIADIAINSNIGKELGKGGLRVKARREQERPRSSVLVNEIRMLSPNLEEKCHGTVDIASHRRQLPKSQGGRRTTW